MKKTKLVSSIRHYPCEPDRLQSWEKRRGTVRGRPRRHADGNNALSPRTLLNGVQVNLALYEHNPTFFGLIGLKTFF